MDLIHKYKKHKKHYPKNTRFMMMINFYEGRPSLLTYLNKRTSLRLSKGPAI